MVIFSSSHITTLADDSKTIKGERGNAVETRSTLQSKVEINAENGNLYVYISDDAIDEWITVLSLTLKSTRKLVFSPIESTERFSSCTPIFSKDGTRLTITVTKPENAPLFDKANKMVLIGKVTTDDFAPVEVEYLEYVVGYDNYIVLDTKQYTMLETKEIQQDGKVHNEVYKEVYSNVNYNLVETDPVIITTTTNAPIVVTTTTTTTTTTTEEPTTTTTTKSTTTTTTEEPTTKSTTTTNTEEPTTTTTTEEPTTTATTKSTTTTNTEEPTTT
ncbi:MAG: hypothetical protein K2I06_11395, partial [Ruminococcus sp.]|nr:hypothetical protein [Ruminococcus sp.]